MALIIVGLMRKSGFFRPKIKIFIFPMAKLMGKSNVPFQGPKFFLSSLRFVVFGARFRHVKLYTVILGGIVFCLDHLNKLKNRAYIIQGFTLANPKTI